MAFQGPKPANGNPSWLILFQDLPLGTDLDAAVESAQASWTASHSRRFERLLRETGVPIGLITNRIYRILAKLLMLDGERLSYRTLDVEQIGSVYETMMGFKLEIATGQTIALKPAKSHGAPVPVNLDELLATPAKGRGKYLADQTDYKLPAGMNDCLKGSGTVDVLAALERRIARNATPQPVPAGTMLLMPTDERRKSGSHYTPRTLTEPIVRKGLEPILKQLGDKPTPDDILNLKVCDPAMGSGAFLVEGCRQLADELVKAWAAHGYPQAAGTARHDGPGGAGGIRLGRQGCSAPGR